MNRGAELAREILRERGKKRALAKELGIDPAVVSNWLSGARRPDTVQRAHLEDRYGIGWRLWDDEATGAAAPHDEDEEESAPDSDAKPNGEAKAVG
ncbi:MAG TPA: hypothetical protein VGK73_06800 [Polyangiaceae bacterium]